MGRERTVGSSNISILPSHHDIARRESADCDLSVETTLLWAGMYRKLTPDSVTCQDGKGYMLLLQQSNHCLEKRYADVETCLLRRQQIPVASMVVATDRVVTNRSLKSAHWKGGKRFVGKKKEPC